MNVDLAKVKYSFRSGCFHSVFEDAENALKRDSCNRVILLYYKAVSRGMNGHYKECIDDLEFLRKAHRLLEYPVISALQYFYTELVTNNQDMEKLRVASKAAFQCIQIEGAILAAEFFLWVSGNYFKASRCLDEISGIRNNAEKEIRRVSLWLEVASNGEFTEGDAALGLEYAEESNDLDCLMALTKYHEMRGNTTKALKTLLIIKSHESSFFPALIEMSKLYLAMGNFALAEDASRTASAMATNHIEARYILTMTKFLSRSDKKERHICLGKLVQLCRDQEVPFSSKLWLRFVQQFPRLCGHDLSALRTICDSMAKDSISQLNDSAVLIEYARILRCVGRYHDSISHYELASQIDDSIKAEGMVLCQALIGDLQQAKYQIEFFELVHEDDPCVPIEIMFAKMLVSGNTDGCHYDDAFKTIERALSTFPDQGSSMRSYGTFDLPLVLEIIHRLVCQFDYVQCQVNDSMIERICTILRRIVEFYPSNVEAYSLLTKIFLESNDHKAFQATFNTCLQQCHQIALAQTIKAEYNLSTGNMKEGLEILEEALSMDFGLQKHPYFCFVKGSLFLETGEIDAADAQLSTTLDFISNTSTNPTMSYLTQQNIITCFINMGKTLKKRKHLDRMDSLISSMDKMFVNAVSFQYLKTKSDLLLQMGKIESALEVFDKVPIVSTGVIELLIRKLFKKTTPHFSVPISRFCTKDSNEYKSAQLANADIHLKQNDKDEYIKCHTNLVKMKESKETLSMLGDASAKMGLLSKAIKAYLRALDIDPLCEALAIKIGSIYMDTQETDKAVHIFSQYLKRAPQSNLVKMKLFNLYSVLECDKDALRMLKSITRNQDGGESLDRETHVKLLLATADIYHRKGQYEKAKDCLLQAKAILKKTDTNNLIKLHLKEDGKTMATILSKLSDCQVHLGSIQLAIESIQSALQFHPKYARYSCQLATYLYKDKQYDQCILQCEENCSDSEEAMLLILASLTIKAEFDTAMKKCADCYKRHKDYAQVLCKYIVLLQNTGDIAQVDNIFNYLKKREAEGNLSVGQNMCMGLCKHILGDAIGALVSFNVIRRTKEWSHEATRRMIHIYLRLGDFEYWSCLRIKPDPEAIKAADVLLSNLENTLPSDREVSVLRGYWEMTALDGNFKIPLKRFSNLLEGDEDYIPALLGFAIIKKQSARSAKLVRNRLKKIAKMPHDISYTMEFERSYLLLADDYIERGKVELAQDLAKRCLHYNRSSIKAWETLGKTLELTDGDWNDVVQSYEKCWSLDNKSSCLSGYRLAALYLKLNEPTEAMNILPHVYRLAPEHLHVKNLVSTLATSLRP